MTNSSFSFREHHKTLKTFNHDSLGSPSGQGEGNEPNAAGSLLTTTADVAEYRAVIEGLKAAERFAARRLILRADSKLVVEQLRGAWRVKQHHLVPLWREARSLLHRYDAVTLEHVGRALNTEADALVNAALDAQASRE